MRLSQTVLLAAILAAGHVDAGQDWPQFRGPRGDGTSAARNVPLTWSESNNIAWKVAVPGRGRSSPVVMKDRIWLTTAIEQGLIRTNIKSDDMQTAEHVTLQTVCLDAKQGKELWRTTLFEVDKPAPVHWFNSWATPSPVAERGGLYCDFGTLALPAWTPGTARYSGGPACLWITRWGQAAHRSYGGNCWSWCVTAWTPVCGGAGHAYRPQRAGSRASAHQYDAWRPQEVLEHAAPDQER